MQVKLSCDDTTVPAGHALTHCPFERNEPGMHAVHCSFPAVDAWSKSGILHAEHFAGHATRKKIQGSESQSLTLLRNSERNAPSHDLLLLSAMRVEPSHTPSELAPTQPPLNANMLGAQTVQSFDVPPVQLWHDGEQGEQVAPFAKLPVQHIRTKVSYRWWMWNERHYVPWGQTVPLVVDVGTGVHLVRSLASWVKPGLHVKHTPVSSAQRSQPSWQTANKVSAYIQMSPCEATYVYNPQWTSGRIHCHIWRTQSRCPPSRTQRCTHNRRLRRRRRSNSCTSRGRSSLGSPSTCPTPQSPHHTTCIQPHSSDTSHRNALARSSRMTHP